MTSVCITFTANQKATNPKLFPVHLHCQQNKLNSFSLWVITLVVHINLFNFAIWFFLLFLSFLPFLFFLSFSSSSLCDFKPRTDCFPRYKFLQKDWYVISPPVLEEKPEIQLLDVLVLDRMHRSLLIRRKFICSIKGGSPENQDSKHAVETKTNFHSDSTISQ